MQKEPLKTLKVLFVEDEKIIREKISSSLSYIVGEVVCASDGMEALEALKSFSPDLIMTDIEMPHVNGIELIKKVRQKDKDICIMVLTAYTSEKYLLELINLHIEKYIVKPLNFDKIIEALNDAKKAIQKSKGLMQTLPKEYTYDWSTKELTHSNALIKLTKKEIGFLELLLENGRNLTSYEQLQNVVWKDSVMTDNALRSMVKNLRKKLPDDFIENLSGIGYRLA